MPSGRNHEAVGILMSLFLIEGRLRLPLDLIQKPTVLER